MISYNQVLNIFKEIAGAHLQVKQFGAGDPADIPEGVNYPLTWVVYDPSEINLSTRSNEISFKMLFADLLHEDKSNEQEILSDQKQIACDIVAQLQLRAYRDAFEVGDIVKLEPIVESITTDSIAGWLMSLTLRTDYLSNACDVPSTLQPGELPGCPPVTIVDSEGYTIAIVDAGFSHVITDSNVHNSDNSYSVNVKPQHNLSLPDSTIVDSEGTILHTLPATLNQVIPDSNVRNSDASYTVNVLSEQDLVLPDSEIRDSAGNLLYTIPATQDQAIADTTVKNSAGATIGTGHAESIVTLADKALSNSNSSFTSPIVQGLDKTLPDISITEGDGEARTYPSAINVTTSQRTFEHVVTLAAGSFLQAGFQVVSQGTIKSVSLTNVSDYTVQRVRAGTISTVTLPFTVQKDDIVQVTAAPTNSAQDCVLDFLGYHDVLNTNLTIPAKNGDGRYLYVINVVDQTVSVIDTSGHVVIATISLPAGKQFQSCLYRSANKTGWFFGILYHAVIDCDPTSATFNSILSQGAISINNAQSGCCYDYINDRMYTGTSNNAVYKVNPNTLSVVAVSIQSGYASARSTWMQFLAPLKTIYSGDEQSTQLFISTDSDLPVYGFGIVILGQLQYNYNNGKIYQSGNQQLIIRSSNPIRQLSAISNNCFARGGLVVVPTLNKVYGCTFNLNSIGVANTSNDTNIGTITKSSPASNELGTRQLVYSSYSGRVYGTASASGGQTSGVDRVHIFNPTNDTYQGYVTVGNLDTSTSSLFRGHQMFVTEIIL